MKKVRYSCSDHITVITSEPIFMYVKPRLAETNVYSGKRIDVRKFLPIKWLLSTDLFHVLELEKVMFKKNLSR